MAFCFGGVDYDVICRAMMEYGQSSGMVNVDGTMMPDPSKHPELEAMVSLFKLEGCNKYPCVSEVVVCARE